MTTSEPDAYWRRPEDGDPAGTPPDQPGPASDPRPGYPGPPMGAPPPPGWRTPMVAAPHAPRHLPDQDHAALDGAERQARTLTYGVGILAGAVVLILLFAICARLLT